MKYAILFLLVVSLVLAACKAEMAAQAPVNVDAKPSTPIEQDLEEKDNSQPSPVLITREELQNHNTKEDCWLLIDGKVYNVSNFDKHPGGEAVYEGCGTDSTDLFETRPMGSGTPHSEKARGYMVNYYIGDIS